MPIESVGASNTLVSQGLERLSTGNRVNSASDDAAGLAVAEGLDALTSSEEQASRNVNDAISVSQVTSGAASQVGDILTRMRELAVQAASDTLSDGARQSIQEEFAELSQEVDRIAETTEFNGVPLTDGSQGELQVQAGAGDGADSQIALPTADLRAETLGVDTASMDLSSAEGARAALGDLDAAIDTVNTLQSEQGATQNRLSDALEGLSSTTESYTAAASRITDADYAEESAKLAAAQLQQDISIAVQSHQNLSEGAALKLLG